MKFVEENHLLHPNQHGFRNGRSCLTQLIDHIDDVLTDLVNDNNADVMYLDFSKAFDKVDHKILLKKLKRYGIRGKILSWISSFLQNRTQFVIVDRRRSKIIAVISGVPQGTVLGPLLFLLYINDIFDVVKNCNIQVFADDSKLHKVIRSLIDKVLLHEDLEAVMQWTQQNNMELNSKKFQLLQHGKNEDLKLPYILPGGRILYGEEDAVKDLGVHVDPDINWSYHISQKITDSKNKASWLLRTFKSRDKTAMLLLYKTYVRFLLEYCCPLWAPTAIGEISSVESVQRVFTSKITDISTLNYWERLKSLDMFSLQRRRERYSIILMWKMQKGIIPNCINAPFNTSDRRGVTSVRPRGKSRFASVNTLLYNSFSSNGPALFNLVPPHIKSIENLDSFKLSLDKWLKSFPDTPPTPNYVAVNRNSIKEWVTSKQN